jgi:ABC-type uncharacterized transport system permease subunit
MEPLNLANLAFSFFLAIALLGIVLVWINHHQNNRQHRKWAIQSIWVEPEELARLTERKP